MSDHSPSRDERPDLDETMNVPMAHGSLGEGVPALDRERRLRENGMEPVSLWLILVSAFVVLVGGAVMGQGGTFFGYSEVVKQGYTRAQSPLGDVVVLLPGPALELYRKEGAKIYSKCSSCHQPSGSGQGDFPPLAGSEWVTGNTEILSQIILHGIVGPVDVAGKTYNPAGGMPTQASGLGKRELATLMTFIRSEWGNDASPVSMEMAENALEIAKARQVSGQVTVEELMKDHDKMLEGAALAPDTLVDPETLEPVEGAAE